MNRLALSFVALSNSRDLTAEADVSIILEFISIFKGSIDFEHHKIEIEALQQNTSDVRNDIDSFVKKYSAANPIMNQINEYFKSLEDNEHFFIMPISDIDKMDLYIFLSSLKDKKNFEESKKEYLDLFGDLRNEYSIHVFDGNKKYEVGEKAKDKRICRYCGKSMPKVSFKKVAHAISEALGNKKIVSLEECDVCNQKFGDGIEEDLILYLQLFRSFFGIQRKKGGNIHFKGENFDIKRDLDGKIKMGYIIDKEQPTKEDLEAPMSLKTYESINFQNIYRTLAKYAIGVMNSNEMKNFSNTISWINGEKSISELPKVAVLISYAFFDMHPKIMLYIRKTDNINLPYCVCELHFVHLTFSIIIPLSSMDTNTFINNDEYDTYWKFFKHYQTGGWNFYNFSNDTKQDFRMRINFELRNKNN